MIEVAITCAVGLLKVAWFCCGLLGAGVVVAAVVRAGLTSVTQ